jgi:glutamate decarboxylase
MTATNQGSQRLASYFVNDGTLDACRKWMHASLEMALGFIQNREGHKLHSDISLPELEKLFSFESIPNAPKDLELVWEDAKKRVIQHSVHVGAAKYIGHMTGPIPFFLLGVELLIAALNQNVVKIETALSASFVEGQVIAWLHKLCFGFEDSFYQSRIHKPHVALGNMTQGGTLGNLTALVCARNHTFPEIERKGMFHCLKEQGYQGAVVLVSRRGHYSVKKCCVVMGLGDENVIEIPVVPWTNQIDLNVLQEQILRCQEAKLKIVAIVGVAGSTETGSIDDLESLSRIAQAHGIWLHVDAAWGGALQLSPSAKPLFAGMEKADSVVLDGHKLFYLPLSHGCVVFKNPRSLDSLRHNARYIIRSGSVDLGRTSLEGSRRFDSLKLWFSLQVLGTQGFAEMLELNLDLCRAFVELVDQSRSFESTSDRQTNIFTYRFIPPSLKDLFYQEVLLCKENQPDSSLELVQKLNQFFNEINVEIQKKQRLAGKSFVSRTSLESFLPGQETVVLRVVFMNPLTKREHLSEILDEQMAIGAQRFAQRWPVFLATLKKPLLLMLRLKLAQ